ncbi:MAG TPA: pyridoxamine 5'-phosphate oxidase family protein [Chloroflexota bacterium]|nr:pyridoxamine 5'-phosphate oxidase family protein [Chloroflexota bacterium]
MSEQHYSPGHADPTPSRPGVPASYGISAQIGDVEQFPWSWADEQLAQARNYWICTTRPDGRPHAMPVWGLWLDGAFYFATDPRSQKGRNLAASPQIVVHLESGDNVVILEGVVEQVTDTSFFARFVDAYDAKYHFRPDPGSPENPIFCLRPSAAFTWQESSFVESARRWRFDGD